MKEDVSVMSTLPMQELSSSLTPERLEGTNYTEWSLNAENKIRGRKRWGFIYGKKAVPKDKNSEEYETWEDENCMVKSWLLDAITKNIRSLFIRLPTDRLPTAKEIWDIAKKTYSVSQDASKAYQLYCEITSIRQNGGSVISYFGNFQRLWQELDAIENCTMECSEDIEKYTTKVNSQHVYVFLAGLDSHLDGVRGRILATIPLPDIQTVYANVCAGMIAKMKGHQMKGLNIHTKEKIGSGKRSGGVTCSSLQRGNENDEVQNHNIQDIISLDIVAKPKVTSDESPKVTSDESSTETQNNDGTRHPFPIPPIPLIQSTPENSLEEALADSRWTQAMEEEMAALKRNTTWDLVSLPTGKKIVGYRWVFTVKQLMELLRDTKPG